jgi:predicted transcriptional regulator
MDILKVVRDGAEGPTQIMFRANLSWVLAKQHIAGLVGNGILSEHSIKKKVIYKLTDKGISILRSYWAVVDQFIVPNRAGSSSENWAQQRDTRISS